MNYTKERVSNIYVEASCRLARIITAGDFEDDFDRREYQKAMAQGIQSALIESADNWADVFFWCTEMEQKLGW